MAAQKGSAFLLKIGDGASPEVFTACGGLRTKSLQINAEEVDVSDSDSASKFRELLAGAGMKGMSFSGSGVFKDSATEGTLQTEMLAQTIKNYQFVVPGLGTFEGPFQLTQMEYSGEYNGAVQWAVSMMSAGVVTFV